MWVGVGERGRILLEGCGAKGSSAGVVWVGVSERGSVPLDGCGAKGS